MGVPAILTVGFSRGSTSWLTSNMRCNMFLNHKFDHGLLPSQPTTGNSFRGSPADWTISLNTFRARISSTAGLLAGFCSLGFVQSLRQWEVGCAIYIRARAVWSQRP